MFLDSIVSYSSQNIKQSSFKLNSLRSEGTTNIIADIMSDIFSLKIIGLKKIIKPIFRTLFNFKKQNKVELNGGKIIDINQTTINYLSSIYKNVNRKEKYENFIVSIFLLKTYFKFCLFRNYKKKAKLIALVYICLRILDDLIDGDLENSLSPLEKEILIDDLLKRIVQMDFRPNQVLDTYLLEILKISRELNIEKGIKYRISQIISSMKFDISRISMNFKDTNVFRTSNELNLHYDLLDIEGTIGGMLLVFGIKDSCNNLNQLKPLGYTCRYLYDLRDLNSDFKNGLCNISKEDLNKFKIKSTCLLHAKDDNLNIDLWSLEMKKYAKQRKIIANNYLKKSNKNLSRSFFSKRIFEPLNANFINRLLSHYREYLHIKVILNIAYIKEIRSINNVLSINKI